MILGMVYDSVYHMISANQFQVSHVGKNIYDNLLQIFTEIVHKNWQIILDLPMYSICVKMHFDL